jgi:putative heme-binding domain-containing protein
MKVKPFSHGPVLATLGCFALLFWMSAALQGRSPQADRAHAGEQGPAGHSSAAIGEGIFAARCAGCHGLDGRGGERAPNIAGNAKVQHLSDSQIASIISDGIPGTGMPPFRSLKDEQIRAVVSYLRVLQGKQESRPLPGNAGRGKEIFLSKGECSACHAISGEGGFLGPDLSAEGSTMSAEALLEAILKPNRIVPAGYKSAIATTRDGQSVTGVVRNEDNFSVQLQAKDGSFYFWQKSELQNLEYLSQPLMPTNYNERLTRSELNDLVSYLMTAGSQSRAKATKKPRDDDE